MKSHTLRLSKPVRLKIKKKISALMNMSFRCKHISSPSKKQFMDSSFNNMRRMVPFPQNQSTSRGLHNGYSRYYGISKGILERFYVRDNRYQNLLTRHYYNSCYIPCGAKVFSISNEPDAMKYVIGEMHLTIEEDACVFNVYLTKPNSRTEPSYYYNYTYQRYIRIRYKPERKTLSITTTLDEDSYVPEKMIDVINEMIYNAFTY